VRLPIIHSNTVSHAAQGASAFLTPPMPTTKVVCEQTGVISYQPKIVQCCKYDRTICMVILCHTYAGVALYNGALKQVPLRTMLWWSMILGALLGEQTDLKGQLH